MLANQLPLLELADRDVFDSETVPLGDVGRLLLESEDAKEPAFTVVAISDPSDLLSYDISDTFALLAPHIQFANVHVKLGRRYLGLVANPLGAHTEHASRKKVIEYIVHGTRAAYGVSGLLRNCSFR